MIRSGGGDGGRRRSRRRAALAAAAVALAGAAVPVVPAVAGAGSPVAASVFFGLDCGAAGELHAVGYPPTYTVDVAITAGPYLVSGMNASLSCTLRRDDPGGPVLTAWGISGAGTGTVPAMVPDVRQFTVRPPDPIERLYVCSRVTWTTVNGLESRVGCEQAGGFRFFSDDPADSPWSDVHPFEKRQDHDLDSAYP